MIKKLPISAFVVNYNGQEYLGDCLASLCFCEQLIVVDKSSTDDSVDVAKRYTDEIHVVDWTPIVEHTRPFALEQCQSEWVLFLDADELVELALTMWVERFIDSTSDDAAAILFKNHYFGRWSGQQRTWPVRRIRLFRRSVGSFLPEIHTTAKIATGRIYRHQESDGGAIMHHGYENVSQWISKANRYTSNHQWTSATFQTGEELFARIDTHLERAKEQFAKKGGEDYEAVTHLLFFLYKSLDELKHWESRIDVDVNQIYRDQRRRISEEVVRYWSGGGSFG